MKQMARKYVQKTLGVHVDYSEVDNVSHVYLAESLPAEEAERVKEKLKKKYGKTRIVFETVSMELAEELRELHNAEARGDSTQESLKKKLVDAYYYDNQMQKDIAEKLNITDAAVRSRPRSSGSSTGSFRMDILTTPSQRNWSAGG